MIAVEALTGMPAAVWEAIVRSCGGHPLHLPVVHEVDLAEKDRVHLVFQSDNRTLACGLAYRRRAGWRKLDLHLPAPLAINVPDDRGGAYHALADFARRSGYRALSVQPHWGVTFEDLPGFGEHANGAVIEFVLDLTPDPDTLLAGMHKVHRKNVRRAERNGLTVRRDAGIDALLALRAMQEVAAERSARRGGGFKVRDRAYFERVAERIYGPGIGELLLAEQNGTPVAALAYLAGAGRAITVRSGATAAGYETYAMYLLQHEVVKRARERGCIEINLGGVSEEAITAGHPEHGLYDFKNGWGGIPMRSTGLSMVLAS